MSRLPDGSSARMTAGLLDKDKWYKGYSFTWSNIKRNILHDTGRTATTGEFKDGSFKIKLTTSDKVSKYSVFFMRKNLN